MVWVRRPISKDNEGVYKNSWKKLGQETQNKLKEKA